MRWGEPTRLPPLRRGRGLAAAALLTVGLVAAYVILGVLSLTSVAPSTLLEGLPTSIGEHRAARGRPGRADARPGLRRVKSPSPAPRLAALGVDLGVATGRPAAQQTRRPHEHVGRTGRLSTRRSLGSTGVAGERSLTTARLTAAAPEAKSPTITVTSNPITPARWTAPLADLDAGGEVAHVRLSGDQAPLPPGAVTATPQAGGAVHVTWPASPSTGVAGYEVDRRVPGGPWQTLDASAPAGGIVDQTGPDGQTVEYRVSAVTAGVQPAPSEPSGSARKRRAGRHRAGSAHLSVTPPALHQPRQRERRPRQGLPAPDLGADGRCERHAHEPTRATRPPRLLPVASRPPWSTSTRASLTTG